MLDLKKFLNLKSNKLDLLGKPFIFNAWKRNFVMDLKVLFRPNRWIRSQIDLPPDVFFAEL